MRAQPFPGECFPVSRVTGSVHGVDTVGELELLTRGFRGTYGGYPYGKPEASDASCCCTAMGRYDHRSRGTVLKGCLNDQSNEVAQLEAFITLACSQGFAYWETGTGPLDSSGNSGQHGSRFHRVLAH